MSSSTSSSSQPGELQVVQQQIDELEKRKSLLTIKQRLLLAKRESLSKAQQEADAESYEYSEYSCVVEEVLSPSPPRKASRASPAPPPRSPAP